MNLKRLPCFILALVFLLAMVGCGSDNEDTSSEPSTSSNSSVTTLQEITLLYAASDSLNPYKAETQLNRKLSLLMYDPLVKVDASFQPQFVLAKSVELDGKDCVVTLKDALFTDGSTVTAEDVVFSYKKAIECELTAYKQQLSNVKSCKSDENGNIRFTLYKVDPYFANLLDFPVIKKGSDTLTNENKIALPPIGSGSYVFDTENSRLTANPKCSLGVPNVKTVKLINAPDELVEKYNLEVGNVSIYYTDLADGVIPPMSGNSYAVNLNNLVYLGVNLNNTYLKDAKMRYVLSTAVDRTIVSKDAYFGHATPATGLFNATWEDAGSLQNLTKTADLENVVAILKDIGYNSKDEEGFFVNPKGKTISFKLIVNQENERRVSTARLVEQQLEAAGIKIELEILEWNKYVQALNSGYFDLYIAEVELQNNMDVTELVTSGGTLAYGIPDIKTPDTDKNKTDSDREKDEGEKTDGTVPENTSYVPLLDHAVSGFYGEKLSLVDIINAFNAEMPIIPLCHRQGITVCSANLKAQNMSSVSDAYFGVKYIK